MEDEVISTKKDAQIEVKDDSYEKGKIYKYDGVEFVEIQVNDEVVKVPITPEAMDAVADARKRIHDELKRRSPDKRARRPELDVVASVMLMQAAAIKVESLAEGVFQFYKKLYS